MRPIRVSGSLDADGGNCPAIGILRLAGEITRMIHDETKSGSAMPSNRDHRGGNAISFRPKRRQFRSGAAGFEAIGTMRSMFLPDDATLTIIDNSGAGRTAVAL